MSVLVGPVLSSAEVGPLTRTNYASLLPFVNDYPYWKEQVKSSTRVLYESDPAGQRGVVQRIEVQPGDKDVFGSGSGERAEVAAQGPLGGFVDGRTVVMSWSTLIDAGFESPPGDWNNFVQIHPAGSAAPAVWQLSLAGGNANLHMRLFGGGGWTGNSIPEGSIRELLSLGPLAKNQWHDFVVEVRFGCTGKGFAKVWRDGKLIVDAQKRKIGYCGDPSMYWKQGFYRSAYDKVTRLWFDDTLRWAQADDAFAYYGWGARKEKSATG